MRKIIERIVAITAEESTGTKFNLFFKLFSGHNFKIKGKNQINPVSLKIQNDAVKDINQLQIIKMNN